MVDSEVGCGTVKDVEHGDMYAVTKVNIHPDKVIQIQHHQEDRRAHG